jgi:hypothetical protein
MARRWTDVLCALGIAAICAAGTATAAGQKRSPSPLRCEAAGKSEIAVDCQYPGGAVQAAGKEPGISLDRATIHFSTGRDNYMHIDLTFRNAGKAAFTDARTLYIEFDDPTGQNYIRRPLPHVDFRALAPGETKTFSDIFLAPALPPGRYLVQLWIPDPNPALKFDAAHNLLLSNVPVSGTATRLNQIAAVTVGR